MTLHCYVSSCSETCPCCPVENPATTTQYTTTTTTTTTTTATTTT